MERRRIIEVGSNEEFEIEARISQLIDLHNEIGANELKNFLIENLFKPGQHLNYETKTEFPNKPVNKNGKDIQQ